MRLQISQPAGASPIGVQFCTAVRPHLRQACFYFEEDSPGDGRVLGVDRAPYGEIMLLVEALVLSSDCLSARDIW